MAISSPSKYLSRSILVRDIAAYNALPAVGDYPSSWPEASAEGLRQHFDQMLAQRQQMDELKAQYRAAVDALRVAEWDFHNAILVMRAAILSHFGADSDQIQAVGLKKKSKRLKPKRLTPKEVVE